MTSCRVISYLFGQPEWCCSGASYLVFTLKKNIIAVRGKAPNQRSTKSRCDRPQTGVNSACAWAKRRTPGTSALTKLSPERATENITCLISNCLYLCRPFGTFHVVAQLPGVNTPVCDLSSLRDFRVSHHELLLSRKPNYRRISRGALDFPQTTIKKHIRWVCNSRILSIFAASNDTKASRLR